MRQLLASAGIDGGWQLVLASDGQGGVTVNSDHPDQEKIEALLQTNPDLIEKFRAVEAAFRALRTSSQPADDRALPETFQIVFEDEQADASFAT